MNITSIAKFNKIPSTGFVPESSGTAPSSPVNGQLWIDTSVTPKLMKVWDGSAWAACNLYGGTGAANYTVGNDARLSDQRVPTDGSVTGGTAGAGVKIAATTITLANLAASLTDGTAGSKQVRSLGTGATDAAAGNDSRLSDTRTPSASSIVDSMVAAGAAIAESKLNLASDAATGTASRRTLGYSGLSAMPGVARLDQIAAPTAAVSMNNNRITGVAPSSAGTDAVNRNELDAARQGYAGAKDPVRVVATTNITVATPGASIDGVSLSAGDRVLLTAQTTTLQNGIYVWNGSATPMTRSTDADAALEIQDGTTVAVADGTKAGSIYVQTAAVGSNAPGASVSEVWTQFSTPSSLIGTANRISITGNQVDIDAAYVGQSSITTLGTITTGVWNGTDVAVADGGTGSSTAAGARTNLGAAQAGYYSLLGALTAGTPLTVTHSLNTERCIAQVRDATTGEYVYPTIIDAPSTLNTLTVTADINVSNNAWEIIVVPI